MQMPKAVLLTAALTLGLPALSLAQTATPAQGNAAAAISDAVQEGASPYRPPSASDVSPEEARRAKCEELKNQYNAAAHAPKSYSSPGTATQNAQGRAVPKIERDKSRQSLEDTYRANCT
jgi:hypothetical protein